MLLVASISEKRFHFATYFNKLDTRMYVSFSSKQRYQVNDGKSQKNGLEKLRRIIEKRAILIARCVF